jgi:hypothetical protein
MRYDRRVIGYHACAKEVADRLLLQDEPFKPSANAWDWLGYGVYFWEFGHQRAYDWATQWPKLRDKEFGVVGAIIQLGECLDLLDTDHTNRLATFAEEYQKDAGPLPENQGPRRHRDCFLVNRFCEHMDDAETGYDTVRGLFQEGPPVVAGSAISTQNHIQVVVRRPQAIIGLFRPRGFTAWKGG